MKGPGNHPFGDLAGREGRHRGEGVPSIGIAQAELPIEIASAAQHRAVLCQDQRLIAARGHLLGDSAAGKGGHRREGVPAIVVAKAELSEAIVPTGEERAVLDQDDRVASPSNHLFDDLAAREGRHRRQGVSLAGIAEAELPMFVQAAREYDFG